jgi:hypothetical protein
MKRGMAKWTCAGALSICAGFLTHSSSAGADGCRSRKRSLASVRFSDRE